MLYIYIKRAAEGKGALPSGIHLVSSTDKVAVPGNFKS